MPATKTLTAPNRCGEPAGQRHHDRLGDRVGGDHPGALVGRDRQAAGDVRHRDVGDGHVEHDHEVADRQQEAGEQQRAALHARIGGVRAGRRSRRRPWPLAGLLRRCRCRRSSRGRPASGWRVELLRIERDAHRQALHDLDPVAGGVLRRDERRRPRRCRRPDPRSCRGTSRRRRRGRWSARPAGRAARWRSCSSLKLAST